MRSIKEKIIKRDEKKYQKYGELEKEIDATLESAWNIIKKAKEIRNYTIRVCGLLYQYSSLEDIDETKRKEAIKRLRKIKQRIDKKLIADITSVRDSLDIIKF